MSTVNDLTAKERLVGILRHRQIDRPPVICTGGMMNAAIVDVMNRTGHTLPEAHSDAVLMAELAGDVYQQTGFENLGIPFCLTVEAEVLGSAINIGDRACEPKIASEAFSSTAQVLFKDLDELLSAGRIHAVATAATILADRYPDVPVIGNVTGPISTTASIVDPMRFLKDMAKDKASTHRAISYATDFLCKYVQLLLDHGVTLISIGDPTATGEILGPRFFEEYAVRYLNRVIDTVHAAGGLIIVHICGNINSVKRLIPEIRSDAISTDAMVNLRLLKEEYPQLTTMGNLSTYLLQFGSADKIAMQARRLVQDGIDIISPACGLSTSTSLENIRAMTEAVKECHLADGSLSDVGISMK